MNYTDKEIEALARLAISPDSKNWDLFIAMPIEARVRAFDLWWERWEDAEFEHEVGDVEEIKEVLLAYIESTYQFLDLEIILLIGRTVYFSVEILTNDNNRIYDSMQQYHHNSTDKYPLDTILSDTYNAIKNHITQ